MKKVVVVGGGVAAKSFISASFAVNEKAEYKVIRSNKRGPVPCGIPYALGSLEDPNDNISPDKGILDNGAYLIIDEILEVDRGSKKVITSGGEEHYYDKLILATGSKPVFPQFKGKELNGIHIIEKDLDEVVIMRSLVEKAKSVLIVGGGFIGVEIADEINKLGNKDITLVELAPNCLNVAFEKEFTDKIESSLSKHGINVVTGVGVKSFKGESKVEGAILTDGRFIEADLVFVAIGAYPNSELAQKSGLELDEKGAIKVDLYQRTSDENIYAIGDCASKNDIFTGRVSNVRLASIASKEGRIAALNLFENNGNIKDVGIMNLFSTCIDNVYYAAAGMTKSQCISAGFDIMEIKLSAVNKHPIKLDGATETKGIFYFEKESLKLLGAQLSGDKEVAETINALGIAIQNIDTAYDLFAYNYGTHPLATASPNKYIIHQAAQKAIGNKHQNEIKKLNC